MARSRGPNPKLAPPEQPKRQPFVEQVVKALKSFNDPNWLGTQTTLASPYVLGALLEGRTPNPVERGRVLQWLLLQAADALSTPSDHLLALCTTPAQSEQDVEQLHIRLRAGSLHQRVLYWRYVQPQKFASVEHLIDAGDLHVSRTHFFHLLDKAQRQLAAVLVRLLRPALRLETPPAPVALIGREVLLNKATAALRDGKSVGLYGPAGVGKTALAVKIAAAVAPDATFWYTLRPGVNTSASSLLYELAVFLAQHGAGNLWRHLVTLGGAIPKTAISELRFDLAQFSAPVLLCVDELDLLEPGNPAHTEVLDLLQALHGRVPLLLIGQQVALEVDHVWELEGFELDKVALFLDRAGVTLSGKQQIALHRYTAGNPRLLHLFVELHRAEVTLDEFLGGASTPPQLSALLGRIVRRLSEAERETLYALAAYDRPAPDNLGDITIVERLIARRLMQRDGPGQVSVAPALRGALVAEWDTEERCERHLVAGQAREARGETVAALYHYLQADLPDIALMVWIEGQPSAVAQGQGTAALALLQQIPVWQLPQSLQRDLELAIGDLALLTGQPTRTSITDDWPKDDPRTARRRRIEGTIEDVRGRLVEAHTAYKAGLRTVTQLAKETSIFHKNLSWVAMRQRDLDESWREACLARYEAINVQGYVREEQGDDSAAHTLYLEALALAQEHGFRHGEAKTCNNLARLAARRQQIAIAEEYAQRAIRLSQAIGDLPMVASVQINLALAFNQAGRPQAALEPALAALAFFQGSGQPWGTLAAAQNLAEAYLALGQPHAAERYAQMVVDGDEPKTLPDGLRVLGEIALARGQSARALLLVCAAIRAAHRSDDRFLEAYAWRALGQVLLARGKPAGGVAAFDRADTIFTQLQMLHELAITAKLRPPEDGEQGGVAAPG